MDETKKVRLTELKAKTERTAEEETELKALEKEELLADISKEAEEGTKKVLTESGLLNISKDGVKFTMIKAEEDKYTAEHRFVAQIKGIFEKNILGQKDYSDEVKRILKAVDPMDIQTVADGGYLVPDVTAGQIIMRPSTYGQARQLFQNFPMGQNAQIIPKYLTGVTAYWVNEEASITASKPTLGYVKLTPHKVGAIVAVTRELLLGAVPNISNYIMNLFDVSFGAAEDTQLFSGSGSPIYGLFYISNSFANAQAIAGTNVNTLAYDDLFKCIVGMDPAMLQGAVWMYHRTIDPYVRGIKDDQNRPIFIDGYNGRPDTLLGYPVVLIEKGITATVANATVSTPFIALGNPKNQLIGDISGMVVDVTKSGYIASTEIFHTDVIAIRAIRQVTNAADTAGTANGLADAFSVISTAAA